jgi:hypothetical protein
MCTLYAAYSPAGARVNGMAVVAGYSLVTNP